MRRVLGVSLFVVAVTVLTAYEESRAAEFEWKDGDRVVLIGDTLIERDQKYGYLETLITAQNPDKAITFRNLGWSGDTVYGHARAGFGKPVDGFRHLKEHVLALKPTVLIVGYGMAESFDGEKELPRFVSGLNALLDAVSKSKPRLILLSPIAHEDLGKPLPDPAPHNKALAAYRDAIRKVSVERKARFVDLFEATLPEDGRPGPLTDNGIHPTAFGHFFLTAAISRSLREAAPGPTWDLRLEKGRELKPGRRSFKVTDATLPPPHPPADAPGPLRWLSSTRTVHAPRIESGSYTLSVDGKAITTADAVAWGNGVHVVRGPEDEQVERLRRAINEKNELYFYRWRPQNETYLFGFRKHEQGNNSREIPLFDPLVEEKEKEIARLKRPVRHVYELTRESEVAK